MFCVPPLGSPSLNLQGQPIKDNRSCGSRRLASNNVRPALTAAVLQCCVLEPDGALLERTVDYDDLPTAVALLRCDLPVKLISG